MPAQILTIYVAERDIPEFNIRQGNKFYKKDNALHRLNDGYKFPVYLNPTEPYFSKSTYKFPCIIGDNISYYPCKTSMFNSVVQTTVIRGKHIYTGEVIDVDESTIKVKRDGTNGMIDVIPHKALIKVRTKYFFINSSGTVCSAVEGADKRADSYRKKTNNIFNDKNEAVNKLYEIMK